MKRESLSIRFLIGLWISLCLVTYGSAMAQGPAPAAPSGPAVNQSDDPLLKNFRWRPIGPASMGGRIDDIAVVESNPFIYLRGLCDQRRLEDDQQRHDL